MPRIEVVGYVDIEALRPELVDLDHPSGLTNEAYVEHRAEVMAAMDDIDFTLIDDEDHG